jgi:DNA-binding MarR family transcriptional regulator
MDDILLPSPGQYFKDSSVRGGLDLLVFAHKSHLQRADDELDTLGLGRAHHRMLYFVARRPGMMTSELIDMLQITKQSAARVLSALMDKGYLRQATCEHDRRRRLLYLTCEGAALEERIAAELRQNMKRAYSEAGEEAVHGYWVLMQRLMTPEMRRHFQSFHEASAPDADLVVGLPPKSDNAARSNG